MRKKLLFVLTCLICLAVGGAAVIGIGWKSHEEAPVAPARIMSHFPENSVEVQPNASGKGRINFGVIKPNFSQSR